MLFGQHHMNVARIEQKLPVSIVTRGNEVFIQGGLDSDVDAAAGVLRSLYELLEHGHVIGHEDVDSALRMASSSDQPRDDKLLELRTHRRAVKPRSPNQAGYLSALERHELVFAPWTCWYRKDLSCGCRSGSDAQRAPRRSLDFIKTSGRSW